MQGKHGQERRAVDGVTAGRFTWWSVLLLGCALVAGVDQTHAAPVRVAVEGRVLAVNDPDGRLASFGLDLAKGGRYSASYLLDPTSEPEDRFEFFVVDQGDLEIGFDGGAVLTADAPSRVFIDDDADAASFPNLGTFGFLAGDRWTLNRDYRVEGLGQLFIYLGFVDDRARFTGDQYFPNLTSDDWALNYFFIGYSTPDIFRFSGLAFGSSFSPVPLPAAAGLMLAAVTLLARRRGACPWPGQRRLQSGPGPT